jgi:hypothetical protein
MVAKKNGELPASLAKRVAEAANGLRNGRDVWFVVRQEFPHPLTEYYSEEEADTDLNSRGPGYRKMGPYRTAADCPHKPAIEWIKVKVQGEKEREFRPENVDALFFSVAALDKFFYPYYTALYGAEKAADMRKKYTATSNTASIVCHDPISDECDDDGGDE